MLQSPFSVSVKEEKNHKIFSQKLNACPASTRLIYQTVL